MNKSKKAGLDLTREGAHQHLFDYSHQLTLLI